MRLLEDSTTSMDSLKRKQEIIRDRVRAVVHGYSTGFYLYGRPGTSKTHTVRESLETLNAPYQYTSGYLTPAALFDVIEEHPSKTLVLDDVSAVFSQPVAMQILLSALGRTPGERVVTYQTHKGRRSVRFWGGIIGISNIALDGHQKEVLAALKDRVNMLQYDPTDDEMMALISSIAARGLGEVPPDEAIMVAGVLRRECEERGLRISVRLYVDKAIRDYQMWKSGRSSTHWTDLVRSDLEQQLVELQHDVRDVSRQDAKEAEQRIAVEIAETVEGRADRVAEWQSRTGKSEKSFYRRLKEARTEGVLS